MLLGGGALDGTRVLRSSTVDDAFTNQIGDLDCPSPHQSVDASRPTSSMAGLQVRDGLLLNSEDQPGRHAAGSGSWAGIFNTHFWADPATGITGAIYTQTLPFVESPVLQIYIVDESGLYARR